MPEKPADRAAVARALGIRLDEDGKPVVDSKSLLESVGGRMGIVESSLPSFLFLVAWLITKNPFVSVTIAILPVAGFGIVRLAKRQPLMQVLVGAAVAGFSAWMAFRPGGQTRDYFLSGLITNIAYLIPLGVSVLLRWPLVGVLLGFILGEGTSWRKDKRELALFSAATLVLCAVFVVRLAFELPLYATNSLEALATVKLVLGLPLYALGLWTAWLLVRKVMHRRAN